MADRPKVHVTQDHISRAAPADSSHCMIAEAVQDALPHASKISVDLATIRYSDPRRGKRYIILTPPIAQQMLLWFDQADSRLEPFEFRLPHAAQVIEAAKRRKGKERKANGEKITRPRATVAKRGSGAVPTKIGGMAPPSGPLAGGPGIGKPSEGQLRTGKRRAYGLRVMAR